MMNKDVKKFISENKNKIKEDKYLNLFLTFNVGTKKKTRISMDILCGYEYETEERETIEVPPITLKELKKLI